PAVASRVLPYPGPDLASEERPLRRAAALAGAAAEACCPVCRGAARPGPSRRHPVARTRRGLRERLLREPSVHRRVRSTRVRVLAVHRCPRDRKSTRLNSSHVSISYAVFCLKKKI